MRIEGSRIAARQTMTSGHPTISHPVFQVVAAGFAISSLGTTVGTIAGICAIIYYVFAGIQFVRNWQPDPSGPVGVGAILAKLQKLWAEDKPYIAALTIVAGTVAAAMGYQIPQWAIGLATAAGVAAIHSISKPKGGAS